MTTTTRPLNKMKRWPADQINKTIRTVFTEQTDDMDFAPYERQCGVLLRANSAMTPELIAVERQYQQFGLVEVEYADFQKFPVPGVFTQGIEGYAIYRGSVYRLLNIARLAQLSKCVLFTEPQE